MVFWQSVFSYLGFGQAGYRVEGLQPQGTAGSSGAGKAVTVDTALKTSAFWACVRIYAEAVGSMPIKFYRITEDGTRTPTRDIPLFRLLNGSPNRYQTSNEFWETMTFNLMTSGNAYARIKRNKGGEIISLLPLMARQMVVNLVDGNRVYKYTDGGASKNEVIYKQDDIWHIPLLPSNGIVGLSPLTYASETLGLAIAANDRVSVQARKGFKQAGVLTIDKILKPEQRAMLRENFKSLNDDGESLTILEADMKYQGISISPKNAQLLESRQFHVEEICRYMNVPPILIHDTSGSTTWGAGIDQIVQGFYKFGLRPVLEKYEASVKRWLVDAGERESIEVEFDFSAFIRGDVKDRMEYRKVAINSGQMTVNEARREEGRADIEGGDEIYMQMQNVPLDLLGKGLKNDNSKTT